MRRAFVRLFDPAARLGTWNLFRDRHAAGDAIPAVGAGELSGEDLQMHYRAHWVFGGRARRPTGEGGGKAGVPAWPPYLGEGMLTTEDGRLGLCPAGTRVGGLVVLLYGGTVPYLLRTVGTAAAAHGSERAVGAGVETAEREKNQFFFRMRWLRRRADGERGRLAHARGGARSGLLP